MIQKVFQLYARLQLGGGKLLSGRMGQRHQVEFIFANKDDVIMGCGVEFAGRIGGLSGVSGGVESENISE
jgi:hypothetical protein